MRRIVFGTLSDPPLTKPEIKQQVNIITDINPDYYSTLSESIEKIQIFMSDTELYGVVIENYSEFLATIDLYANAIVEKNIQLLTKKPALENINRRLLNLLSSFRSYLDFMETRLKREYGESSEMVSKFTAYCRVEYDNNPSYRFIYRLRNFSQHCGFPIRNINFEEYLDAHKSIVRKFSPEIDKVHLLQNFNWKSLKQEIEKFPSSFDIRPPLLEAMKSLKRIHSNITANIFVYLKSSAQIIASTSHIFTNVQGSPTIFFIDTEPNRSEKKISFTGYPIDVAEKIVTGDISGLFPNFENV
jgi:hypothetical protein